MKWIVILFFILTTISCSIKNTNITKLNFEKDLIPEGIVIEGRSKRLYLNSLKNNEIVTSLLDGTKPKNFLVPNQYGYLSGFGMTIKGDTLYALGNSLGRARNKSILLLLQLSTGGLIDSYTLDSRALSYWNDLVVSSKNEIFITDSESNKIYKIYRPSKKFEVYLDSDEIPHSNGITISDNNKYLYLASRKGICIVDIESKQLVNKPEIEFFGVDGLKFYKNSLYGIVNVHVSDKSKNGLFKYELDKTGKGILNKRKLVEFTSEFNVPTTLDIMDGNIYFIANTQLNNFDEDTNKIIDLDKLQTYKLVQLELE